MYEIRFKAVIGPDRTFRLPDNVKVEPGSFDVILMPQVSEADVRAFIDRMAQTARELNIGDDLPADFAENHDHYIHGAPKRVDRP